MSNEQFKACSNCGKTKGPFNNPTLGIYRCSCGKVYCDNCSGGGLIDLPSCPESPYHENPTKVGVVQAQ